MEELAQKQQQPDGMTQEQLKQQKQLVQGSWCKNRSRRCEWRSQWRITSSPMGCRMPSV